MGTAGRASRLVLVLALTAASTGGTTTGVRGAGPLPSAPPRPLSFLHAGPASGPSGLHQIVDQYNREVLLEGVPLCASDFPQMRPLGYNIIRLTLSWSLIEPTETGGIDQPGSPSSVYFDRIAQVVAWAKAQGIYVLLDLHQDAWSKYDYT